ncbi:DUF1996 domain-containing protein [Actinomadura rudentiformis]|uniref:DUF1996 domain-containing protein n=1 Tax=Actinomadura rudentiformis TaxID=359158 RepID=A0A6H9YUF5_9ACTN|nr:DUF1996 domain-containing protein [Actinomadura rudentiformis]KAB2348023.1 DUF1996 domain-containing protein [Actinomadura rudentiformis]
MRHARRPRSISRSITLLAGAGLVLTSLGSVAAEASVPALPAAMAQTINCPDVAGQLPQVPAQAKAEVDRNLALLNTQIQEANTRLANSVGQGGPNFVQNAIVGPLRDKRVATINRIATAIGRVAQRPAGLDALAPCTVVDDGQGGGGQGNNPGQGGQNPGQGNNNGGQNPGQGNNNGGQGNGNAGQQRPVASDFVDIRQVRPNAQQARAQARGSRGTFTSRCGRNENGHFNSDNFIVAPGVANGAHHQHDYVGNLTTDGNSTDESLAAGGTTCSNGDKSTYFWPVVRLRSPNDPPQNDQSAADGNIGRIQRPASVSLQFRGNATSKVTAMPRFIRVITGDAKAATNGPANSRASWTCTGFENRRLTDKYPLCPRGSQVTRILEFPSCWDGRNTDSANHRTHIVFPGQNGACPAGTRAVPQLQMRLTYNINLNRQQLNQGRVYALDSFPEQLHNPVTDHGDFANVMSNRLMNRAVTCINRGQRC